MEDVAKGLQQFSEARCSLVSAALRSWRCLQLGWCVWSHLSILQEVHNNTHAGKAITTSPF